ncbi:MAG: hypothetical protein K940chlam2_00769 [Chlamydiae bacterium]|nr:hypothetical protein [Chlamydiota bacterium]
MFKKALFGLAAVTTACTSLFGMGYQAEVTMKDGTVHTYEGSTSDGRYVDKNETFGHDKDEIESIERSITNYYDDN